jgi:hypothetical protein
VTWVIQIPLKFYNRNITAYVPNRQELPVFLYVIRPSLFPVPFPSDQFHQESDEKENSSNPACPVGGNHRTKVNPV